MCRLKVDARHSALDAESHGIAGQARNDALSSISVHKVVGENLSKNIYLVM